MTARERIDGFLRTLTARHGAFRALHVVTSHALVWATVLLLVDLLLFRVFAPGRLLLFGAMVALVAIAIVAVWAWSQRRPRVAAVDRALRLQDRLLTYAALEGVDDRPMLGWLEGDLDARLGSVAPEQAARIVRRPLGRVRYLLPVLVLILLVWLFAPAMPPIAPRGPEMTSDAGGGGGQGPSQGTPPQPGESESESKPPPEPEPPPPEPQPDPDVPPPDPPGAVEEQPPKALIDLQREEAFVVPDFIGEGESRRMKAKVAVLPEGGGETPAAAGNRGGQSERPPATARDFEKARERALRARHVPATEREFVKRYFEALARPGK